MAFKESAALPTFPSTPRWWSKDTVAIVTGGNRGIGFALVKRLAEMGLTVILTARDNGRGEEAVEALKMLGLSNNVRFFCVDVSDPLSIQTFASWFQANFSTLDILINNAGVSFNNIDENSVEHAETVITTNFYGPKLLIHAFLPMLCRSSSVGRILNISSRLGLLNKLKNPDLRKMLMDENLSETNIQKMVTIFLASVKNGKWEKQGWPEVWTDYAVSKLALNAYSVVLAERYKKCGGLSVNCYCPGFTQTLMTRGKGKYTPDDSARVAANIALLPPTILPTGKFFSVSNASGVTFSKL